jgi:hypothetical protein
MPEDARILQNSDHGLYKTPLPLIPKRKQLLLRNILNRDQEECLPGDISNLSRATNED